MRKLRSLLLSCAALMGCIAAPAFGADLAVRRMPVAVVMPFSWTGFYAGINVGYAWGDPEIKSAVGRP